MLDDFFAYIARTTRLFPLPPEGFDPLRATTGELAKFGLGERPDARLHPAMFEFWARMLKAPVRFITPVFPAPALLLPPLIELREPLGGGRRRGARARREKSRNWSGVYLKAPRGGLFTSVVGRWTVPRPAAPADTPTDAVRDEGYHSSVWIGIDGRRTYPKCSLPQIGTGQVVNLIGGAEVVETNAWWQWWVKDRPETHRPVPILNFPVDPGDEILAWLTMQPDGSAKFELKNETKDLYTCFDQTQQDIVRPGVTAEWIVERPTKVDDTRMYPLPDYGEVVFHDCFARSAPAAGAPLQHDLAEAKFIRMYEVFDAPARIAFVSVPERLDRTSARVSFQ